MPCWMCHGNSDNLFVVINEKYGEMNLHVIMTYQSFRLSKLFLRSHYTNNLFLASQNIGYTH